ncbi:MAG: HAMP domain-containing sensor histidine kinase [Betaproteobacteria bacterium]
MDALRELAIWAGANAMLLFVRDPEVGVLVPAPGCPQTLRGGPSWRSFLAGCVTPGRHAAQVEFPPGTSLEAIALADGRTACILLGGAPPVDKVKTIECWMPLLRAVLDAEQAETLARAEAAIAKGAADAAITLVDALEATRAEGSNLNAQLREEQRRKDEFLAMLGHELRNPLSALVTAVGVLQTTADPRHVKQMTEVMNRQTAQLSRLVEDLLEMSRVSRGQIELRRHQADLQSILADAIEQSRAIVAARGHQLQIDLSNEPMILNADRTRLIQVFANLLSNAAKYTDHGGRISITAERDEKYAVVSVQDNGIGIGADMLESIFDLFTQVKVDVDRSQGGLGIGLTLVRSLVRQHGGNVIAESAGLGQGSTFTIRLPLQAEGMRTFAPRANATEPWPEGAP